MALTRLTNLVPIHVHSIGISTFDGSVSVGGTLTYEDVTNVDAVGVVTARTGIKVLAGGINAVGVVTATDFKKADGSSVGATQVTIGVRSGAAVTFAATGSSFNVINRSGGNVPINL